MRGYELSLRKAEAKEITVEVQEGAGMTGQAKSNADKPLRFCPGGQSQLREDHPLQRTDRQQPVCGQLAGVTVEKKEGRIKTAGRQISVLDLPGIYPFSLFAGGNRHPQLPHS